MMMRSLAYSRSSMPTARCPSRAALSAATLTRLARSAPLKPGVPLAMTCPKGGGQGRGCGEDACWCLLESGQGCWPAAAGPCLHIVAPAAAWAPPPARRRPAQHLEVDALGARDLLKVHLQDLSAPLHIRVGHHHVPVKPARPHQRLIQGLGEVGGRDDNHACRGGGGR